MDRSRIPDFYKMSIDERVRAVREKGLVSEEDFIALSSGDHTLQPVSYTHLTLPTIYSV